MYTGLEEGASNAHNGLGITCTQIGNRAGLWNNGGNALQTEGTGVKWHCG